MIVFFFFCIRIVIYIIPRSKNTTKIWICEIDIRNPEIYETLTTLFFGSGTKLSFTFLSLRFFWHVERETQFLSMLNFPSDPHHMRPPPQITGLASASSENRLASSSVESQLTIFFFKFQNPYRFRVWRHSRPRSHFLVFLLWHL